MMDTTELWREAPSDAEAQCLTCGWTGPHGEMLYDLQLSEDRSYIEDMKIRCPNCKEPTLRPTPKGEN